MSTIATRACCLLMPLFVAAAAFAQNNRSAVSVTGSDMNPCTTVSPCRSFVAALAVTNAGGEVIAFDSGGYGAFTVSKAVSVIGAPGIHAALTVTSGDGIDVAASSIDNVTIRNLNITLTSGAGNGISGTVFRSLSIENCTVNGGGSGVSISGTSNSIASLTDTVVQSASYGFVVHSHAAMVRCRAEGNSNAGLLVQAGPSTVSVAAVDFVAIGNTDGAGVDSPVSGSEVLLSLDRALLYANLGSGAYSSQVGASADAFIWVSNSTAFNNGSHGFAQVGASFFGSLGNNLVAASGAADTVGTISAVTAQ